MSSVGGDLSKVAKEFYPFKIACYDTGHFVQSPYEFRKPFLANKPEGHVWYGYDVIVKSPTEVEFVTYDMRDSYGGLGRENGRFEATVDEAVTKEAIERRLNALAKEVRLRELERAEAKIVSDYGNRIGFLVRTGIAS
jgi:hypothetical protein